MPLHVPVRSGRAGGFAGVPPPEVGTTGDGEEPHASAVTHSTMSAASETRMTAVYGNVSDAQFVVFFAAPFAEPVSRIRSSPTSFQPPPSRRK